MNRQLSWAFVLFALLTLLSTVSAGAPTSFCKCTCFTNSTIVPLNSPVTVARDLLEREPKKKTCNDCTRKFCLDYQLPFCNGANEEDVFVTCFQRDSRKDQAVVFIFIIATLGLLVYATIRPWVEQWAENARERRNYIPISGQGAQ